MRVSTLDFFQRSIDIFTQQQTLINNTQAKIASGKKILSPAEDPIGAMKTLSYRYEITKIDQFLKNVQTADSDLEYEDSILSSITNIYHRLKELAISAGNGSLSPGDRDAIATEMSERLLELQSLANTRAASGDYIFSGFNQNQQPVLTDSVGNYIYAGDNGQRSIMLGESTLVPVSDSGKEIFFNIPSERVVANAFNGYVSLVGTASALVNSGTLIPLGTNDLSINNVSIPAAVSDNISTTDSMASAIAIAFAINSQFALHGVEAVANPTSVNMGIYTPNTLAANQFSINGVAIIDTTGTESSLLTSVNAVSTLTGVTASQPGGAGTAIIFTANDGRNVQLQTNGTATASFANFDLTSGPLDQVQNGTVTLRDHHDIMIGGAFPQHAGLVRGTYPVVNNTGTGVMATPVIIDNVANVAGKFSIVFNAGGTTFNIIDDSTNLPLTGFSNVVFTSGQNIEFAGVRVNITGTPNAGDVFGVELQQLATEDIFNSLNNLINSIKGALSSEELSYQIGVGLDSLDFAEGVLLQTRAKVGARLNIVESQMSFNSALQLIAQQNLSKVEDLDYSQAITQLSQFTFALEAAQQSFIKIQSLSLFYFLR